MSSPSSIWQFLGGAWHATLILPWRWYSSCNTWRLQHPPRKTSGCRFPHPACIIRPQTSTYWLLTNQVTNWTLYMQLLYGQYTGHFTPHLSTCLRTQHTLLHRSPFTFTLSPFLSGLIHTSSIWSALNTRY